MIDFLHCFDGKQSIKNLIPPQSISRTKVGHRDQVVEQVSILTEELWLWMFHNIFGLTIPQYGFAQEVILPQQFLWPSVPVNVTDRQPKLAKLKHRTNSGGGWDNCCNKKVPTLALLDRQQGWSDHAGDMTCEMGAVVKRLSVWVSVMSVEVRANKISSMQSAMNCATDSSWTHAYSHHNCKKQECLNMYYVWACCIAGLSKKKMSVLCLRSIAFFSSAVLLDDNLAIPNHSFQCLKHSVWHHTHQTHTLVSFAQRVKGEKGEEPRWLWWIQLHLNLRTGKVTENSLCVVARSASLCCFFSFCFVFFLFWWTSNSQLTFTQTQAIGPTSTIKIYKQTDRKHPPQLTLSFFLFFLFSFFFSLFNSIIVW